TLKGTRKSQELDGKVICEPFKEHWMTTIKVNLDHLAPPDRLGGGKHFIVWAKDDKGRWNRVGALKYDEKERHGTLEGASANQHSFDLMITVEGDIRGESPSGEAIYSQHIN